MLHLPDTLPDATGLPDVSGLPLMLVHGRLKVAALLHEAAVRRRRVLLASQRAPVALDTRLYAVDLAEGRLLFPAPSPGPAQDALLHDCHCNILCWTGDTPAIGTLDLDRRLTRHGIALCSAPLPPFLFMPQLRQHPRVRVPARRQWTLRYRHPCDEPLAFVVTDLAEEGFGLLLPHLPLCRIAEGDRWLNARLGDIDGSIGTLDLEVRRTSTSASGELLVGVALVDTTEGTRRRLASARQAIAGTREHA